MVDVVPPSAQPSGEHRAAEDAERARKLVKEAEKRRKREQEEHKKGLIAQSRLRAQSTNQRVDGDG